MIEYYRYVEGCFSYPSSSATMAQLVEQRIRNAQVVGSSPTSSSKTAFSDEKAVFCVISLHMKPLSKRPIFFLQERCTMSMESLVIPPIPSAIASLVEPTALYTQSLFAGEENPCFAANPMGFWLIGVDSGAISLQIDQTLIRLDYGAAAGFCAASSSRIYADTDAQILCVHLRGVAADQLLAPTITHSPYFPQGGQAMRAHFHPLLHQFRTKNAIDGATISAAAFALLTCLYQTSAPPSLTDRYPPLVQNAISIMQQDFAHLYGIEDLAERLEVTSSHLIRSFSHAAGITPGQYLTEVRIAFAKRLLRSRSETLENIAACSGFSSAHYFSKVFRRVTGMSPTEYMRTAPPAPSVNLSQIYL